METIRIQARSSDTKTMYNVDFIFDGGRMSVRCSCPAGTFGQFCKHKLAFLKGRDSYLADEEDRENLDLVADWAQRSGYQDLMIKVGKAQHAVDEAQYELTQVHKELGQAMKKGLMGPDFPLRG